MGAIILHRIDPALNMRRFYRLDVQPDLFGFWCLVREWGRLGQAGQVRIVSYPTKDAAEAALQQLRKVKERRGYAAGAIRERQVGGDLEAAGASGRHKRANQRRGGVERHRIADLSGDFAFVAGEAISPVVGDEAHGRCQFVGLEHAI